MRASLLLTSAMAAVGLFVVSTSRSGDDGNMVASARAAEEAVIIAAPKLNAKESGKTAVAVFAGGCFWGVEGVFSHVRGVRSSVSGYAGGSKANADYRKVSAGLTKHAEAVRVTYDPNVVSYGELMHIFFSVVADPTTLNRQGPDRGKHYRTALIPTNKAQAAAARAYLSQLEKGKYWRSKIVTRIEANRGFHPAETYHQDFMFKNPRHPYIQRWDAQKVRDLKSVFPKAYKAKPVRS